MTLPFPSCISYSLFFILFFNIRVAVGVVQPRIRLWSRDDAGDVRIDIRVARRSFVAALLRLFAAHGFRLLLLRSRPFALAFTSS